MSLMSRREPWASLETRTTPPNSYGLDETPHSLVNQAHERTMPPRSLHLRRPPRAP